MLTVTILSAFNSTFCFVPGLPTTTPWTMIDAPVEMQPASTCNWVRQWELVWQTRRKSFSYKMNIFSGCSADVATFKTSLWYRNKQNRRTSKFHWFTTIKRSSIRTASPVTAYTINKLHQLRLVKDHNFTMSQPQDPLITLKWAFKITFQIFNSLLKLCCS